MSSYNRSSRRRSAARDAGRGIGRTIVDICKAGPSFLVWLTTKGKNGGVTIILGLLVIYFAAVSAEGYWQALNSANPAFVPKPFINDGANVRRLLVIWRDPSFWIATVFSLAVQGIQAFIIREIGIARAKAAYEEVKGYRVPDLDEDALDIAEHRRKQFKGAGMRAVKMRGLLIGVVYAVDLAISYSNFPLLGLAIAKFCINAVWLLISLVGTESAINLFLDAQEDDDEGEQPEVEVLG